MIAVVAAPQVSAAGITILALLLLVAGALLLALLTTNWIVKKANVRHLCLLAPLGTTVGATNVPQIILTAARRTSATKLVGCGLTGNVIIILTRHHLDLEMSVLWQARGDVGKTIVLNLV